MPLTLFGALQPEVSDGKNIELLLMSNLTRWQIVLGKLLVGSALSGLMLISLLPYILMRYFVGNVELVKSALGVLGLILINAMMNAIVIGASGFRNYVGRVFLIIFVFICYTITSSITAFSFLSVGTSWSFISTIITSLLFVVLSLQLGRAKLRVFENPLDPPATALIVVLFVACPIFLGIAMAMLSAFGAPGRLIGGPLMMLGMLVLATLIDRGPGRKKPVRWAQP